MTMKIRNAFPFAYHTTPHHEYSNKDNENDWETLDLPHKAKNQQHSKQHKTNRHSTINNNPTMFRIIVAALLLASAVAFTTSPAMIHTVSALCLHCPHHSTPFRLLIPLFVWFVWFLSRLFTHSLTNNDDNDDAVFILVLCFYVAYHRGCHPSGPGQEWRGRDRCSASFRPGLFRCR